jgi:hypothetical protein
VYGLSETKGSWMAYSPKWEQQERDKERERVYGIYVNHNFLLSIIDVY